MSVIQDMFSKIKMNAPETQQTDSQIDQDPVLGAVDINKKIAQPIDYSNIYNLTYTNEVQSGVSNRIHHPTNDLNDKSGVTLGPGYDMGSRSAKDIKKDLEDIGVAKDKAQLISTAAGLKGQRAIDFVDMYKDELSISDLQERQLFNKLAPKYEKAAKTQYSKITGIKNKPAYDDLPKGIKALLVDYAYNVGANKFPSFFTGLITGKADVAYGEYKRYTGGKPLGKRNTDTLDFLNKLNITDLTGGKN